jgi:Ca2+-binding RTX toxin-like protein
LYGYDGNDSLYGYDGNDLLDGGTGNDTMAGGTGNDTYIVDSASDIVTEAAGAGIDRINAYVSDTLNANVEYLCLYGTALNGYGNALDNTIVGNSNANILYGYDGNDILNGLTGNDAMVGGTGNDIYYVDSPGDNIIEAAGAGIDRINAYVSDTLNANVEYLYLYGTATIGAGNALNNTIVGNSIANTLSGLDGNDSLYGYGGNDSLNGGNGNDYIAGGTGNDTLYGIAGLDRFVFAESGSANRDTIADFSHMYDTIVLRDILDGISNSTIKGLSFESGVLKSAWYFEGAGKAGNGSSDFNGIYNDTTTGNIYYNPTSNVAGDSVVICTLGTPASLDNTDFVYSA